MSHQLTLQIPDDLYQRLTQVAGKMGQTPEQLILTYLGEAIQNQKPEDPVEQFIGALRSNVPDWIEQHDAYLGQSHLSPDQTSS
jgi:hypothetical protein